MAAHELMRAGAENVSIFEATNRFGSRTYRMPLDGRRPPFLAELGALRKLNVDNRVKLAARL